MSQLLVAMLAVCPRGGSRATDVRARSMCETRTRCHRRVRKARVARSRPMKGWARAKTFANENVTAFSCQSPPPATGPGLRMALYTYNFGNYREELGRYDTQFDLHDWIEKYFFTDRPSKTKTMRAAGWRVCGVPVAREYIPRASLPTWRPRAAPSQRLNRLVVRSGHRLGSITHSDNPPPSINVESEFFCSQVSPGWDLTKWFKFGHVPAILKGHYDYLLHLDLSAFSDPERRGEYTLPKRAHVAALARVHPASELFLVRHRSRSRVVEEWNKTVALQLERADLACGFARAMRAKFGASVVNAAPLFGLGEFVRKVKDAVVVNLVFRDTHRALVSFGMMRDQNVLPLALWNRVVATTDKVMSCDTRRQDEDLANCVHLAGPGAESRNIQMLGRPLDEPPFTAAAFACSPAHTFHAP